MDKTPKTMGQVIENSCLASPEPVCSVRVVCFNIVCFYPAGHLSIRPENTYEAASLLSRESLEKHSFYEAEDSVGTILVIICSLRTELAVSH